MKKGSANLNQLISLISRVVSSNTRNNSFELWLKIFEEDHV